MLDAVAAHVELVEGDNIFGVIVPNVIIGSELTLDGFLRGEQVTDLHIQLFALIVADKVDFLIYI